MTAASNRHRCHQGHADPRRVYRRAARHDPCHETRGQGVRGQREPGAFREEARALTRSPLAAAIRGATSDWCQQPGRRLGPPCQHAAARVPPLACLPPMNRAPARRRPSPMAGTSKPRASTARRSSSTPPTRGTTGAVQHNSLARGRPRALCVLRLHGTARGARATRMRPDARPGGAPLTHAHASPRAAQQPLRCVRENGPVVQRPRRCQLVYQGRCEVFQGVRHDRAGRTRR